MNNLPDQEKPNGRSLWRTIFRRQLPLEHQTAVFILVNALDVFMTYLLLQTGVFYESNPVAQGMLSNWGIRGMVYFKFLFVAIVCVISQVIAQRNVKTARRLLNFVTLIVAVAVIYSLVILLQFGSDEFKKPEF